jgi:cytochrome c peroxidase
VTPPTPPRRRGAGIFGLPLVLGVAIFGTWGGNRALPLPGLEARGVAVHRSDAWSWELPPGFPLPRVPAENPMSVAKVELGRHLFYDVRLSANQRQSCASCHVQAMAFAEPLDRSVGSTGEIHPRSSMSLANVAYVSTLTWANPLLHTLEEQALIPLFGEDPVELGMAGLEGELLRRLRDSEVYPELFRAAFPEEDEPISLWGVTRALGAFQRSLLSFDSAYDRYLQGDDDAVGPEVLRGESLFFSERLECFHCHGGPFFSGSLDFEGKGFTEVEFFHTGLYNLDGEGRYPDPNFGLYLFTGDPRDMGRFRAPTLKNIAVTGPYMHDGSIRTLDEVLDHYAAGGRTLSEGPLAGVGSASPLRSEFMVGFTLTALERADLLAFLEALTDSTFLTDPRHSDPWASTRRR